MAEQTTSTQFEMNRQSSLDIPWIRQREKRLNAAKAIEKEDKRSRLINVDYMTMLAELEFR